MAEKGSGLAGDTMRLELGVKPEVAGRIKAVGPDLRKYNFCGWMRSFFAGTGA